MSSVHTGDRRVSRQQIIDEALSWVGTPYQHQASCKGAGCDCLGLVRGIYGRFWAEPEDIPPYSPHWQDDGGHDLLKCGIAGYCANTEIDAVQPGDLLLFRYRQHLPAKHAGILVDETHFIHAQQGVGVCLVSLNGWWRRHIAHAFVFPLFPR